MESTPGPYEPFPAPPPAPAAYGAPYGAYDAGPLVPAGRPPSPYWTPEAQLGLPEGVVLAPVGRRIVVATTYPRNTNANEHDPDY